MTGIFRLGGWVAAVVAIAVSVFFGPFVAAFLFVALAFGIIAVLMAATLTHSIDVWRLDHPRLHLPWRHAR
jgi:hypothetical protein